MSRSPTTSSSIANSQSGEGVSMSYYNDAASEFGRKLTLGDRGGPADDMRTRSQAKRESQSKGKSATTRAPAQASSNSKGRGKAAAAPTRRQPRRESSRRTRDPSPDDSDEDEDDDDSDEDDDHDDGGGSPPQTPRMSEQERRRREVLAIMSAFEPNRGSTDPSLHLAPGEFIQAAGGGNMQLNEASRRYLSVANIQAQLVTANPAAFARLRQEVTLNGEFWGRTIATDLQSRAENAVRLFAGNFPPKRDAVDTIREFRRIFDAVAAIFREWPLHLMRAESKQRLAYAVCWILQQILVNHQDVRTAQSGPVFAGNTDASNLFSRFKSTRDDWSHCLTILWQLIHANPNPFDEAARELLRHAVRMLNWHHQSGNINNQSAQDFMTRFMQVVQALLGVAI